MIDFQFPQSERTNCNRVSCCSTSSPTCLSVSTIGTNELQLVFAPTIPIRESLSVSTIGTNELQPFRICQLESRHNAFSFHNRNERTATMILSATSPKTVPYFQFPQSERTNCNLVASLDLASAGALSVSTIGTNELQRWTTTCGACTPKSFSFHNRNERTATGRMFLTCAPMLVLSVSTIGTNELQQISTLDFNSNNTRFQFPQSERTNCNPCGRYRRRESLSPFSFHNRNERTATAGHRRAAVWVHAFQFPQSERTNCNSRSTSKTRLPPMSFSFHNRNERTATRSWLSMNTVRHNLSVSTIGTNELQPCKTGRASSSLANFQFPQSERTNCNNLSAAWSCAVALRFQFPQSERTNCNNKTKE